MDNTVDKTKGVDVSVESRIDAGKSNITTTCTIGAWGSTGIEMSNKNKHNYYFYKGDIYRVDKNIQIVQDGTMKALDAVLLVRMNNCDTAAAAVAVSNEYFESNFTKINMTTSIYLI